MNRLQEIIEQTSTSTNRVKLPKTVNEPTNININDLEAIREDAIAQRRERISEYNSQGWQQ